MLYLHERGSVIIGSLIIILACIPAALSAQSVIEVLDRHSNVSIFVETIRRADLDQKLTSGGPYTIFAPSNAALQDMQDQLNRSNSAVLERFVMNHIMTGMATKRQILVMSKAPTLGGLTLKMAMENNQIMVNDISIIQYNIRAKNGVIHVIDGTLED